MATDSRSYVSARETERLKKKAAKEIAAKHNSNPMNQFQIDAALHKMEAEIESKFTRSPDLYSRLSKFRKVVYEIVSRDMLNDCIRVEAVHAGDDPETVFPEWPPNA